MDEFVTSPNMFPSDWTITSLGEMVENGEANLQTGPFGTALLASEYKLTGTPVVAVKNIGEGNLIYDSAMPHIDDTTKERLSQYILHANDILFGRKGAVDRHAIVTAQEEGWLQGSDCIRLRFLNKTVEAKYISYLLQSETHGSWMQRHAIGSTMPSLNQNILKRIVLAYPLLAEQSHIAEILGAWDDAIALTGRLIDALKRRKQGLMQRLFTGQIRFPEFEGQEWERITVGELLAETISGEWGEEPDDSEDTLPVLRSTNFDNGGYLDFTKMVFRKIPRRKIAKLLLRKGNILLEKSGGGPDQPVGRVAYFDNEGSFVFANFIENLIVKPEYHPKAVFYALLQFYFSGETLRYQQQTTGIRNFKVNEFLKAITIFPQGYEEQMEIADVLSACDLEVEITKNALSALTYQKKGLMQRLLTGQIRVGV